MVSAERSVGDEAGRAGHHPAPEGHRPIQQPAAVIMASTPVAIVGSCTGA